MKNKIKVCVYDSSSDELILGKSYKGVFSLREIYNWVCSNKEMLDLIGEGVEYRWNEKEIKFKDRVYGYKFSLKDSFCYMKFINVDVIIEELLRDNIKIDLEFIK